MSGRRACGDATGEVAGVVHGDNRPGRKFTSGLYGILPRGRRSLCQVRVGSKSEQTKVVGGDMASMSAVNAVLENGGSLDPVTAPMRRCASRLNPYDT